MGPGRVRTNFKMLLKLSTIVLLLVVLMPQIKTRSFPQGDVDMRGDEGVDLWADDNVAMERVKEEKGEKEEKKDKKEEKEEDKEEEEEKKKKKKGKKKKKKRGEKKKKKKKKKKS